MIEASCVSFLPYGPCYDEEDGMSYLFEKRAMRGGLTFLIGLSNITREYPLKVR